jgi:predicted branched-subunit amino acid permease
MTTHSDESASAPPLSRVAFELGARLALPVLPGMIAFGLAVGATAARKGFRFWTIC